MIDRWIIDPQAVKYYDCCQCQTQHYETEPIYQQHIWHQSKHGIKRVTRAEYDRFVPKGPQGE